MGLEPNMIGLFGLIYQEIKKVGGIFRMLEMIRALNGGWNLVGMFLLDVRD